MTNRASNGTVLFNHTFTSSGSASANIGGALQLLNVTLDKFSGLALGIEVFETLAVGFPMAIIIIYPGIDYMYCVYVITNTEIRA